MEQHSDDDPGTWLSLLLPGSSLLVRYISFICIIFGLLVSVPFTFLIIFDFFLWIWRSSWGDPRNHQSRQNNHNIPGEAITSSSTIVDDASSDIVRLRKS